MKEISSVLIAGAGAIGSMVAFQICRTMPEALGILAGGERLARYRETGFEINGEPCSFPLVDAEAGLEPDAAPRAAPDLVIIACKFHHLDRVLADLTPFIGPDTLILSLLNGISSEEIAGAAYGKERIPYAMIIGTDAGHEGNRTTFSKTGTIFFGDARNGDGISGPPRSARVEAIASFFDRAGIAYTVPENMLNRLWFKFMMNVGLNQVTAILRRPYRILKTATRIGDAAELLEAAMDEVVAVAAAEGITLTADDKLTVYRTLDSLTDGGKTSMCQDVEAGRKTEVELFSGTVIALGARHGIAVPVNAVLYRMLKTIEQSY